MAPRTRAAVQRENSELNEAVVESEAAVKDEDDIGDDIPSIAASESSGYMVNTWPGWREHAVSRIRASTQQARSQQDAGGLDFWKELHEFMSTASREERKQRSGFLSYGTDDEICFQADWAEFQKATFIRIESDAVVEHVHNTLETFVAEEYSRIREMLDKARSNKDKAAKNFWKDMLKQLRHAAGDIDLALISDWDDEGRIPLHYREQLIEFVGWRDLIEDRLTVKWKSFCDNDNTRMLRPREVHEWDG